MIHAAVSDHEAGNCELTVYVSFKYSAAPGFGTRISALTFITPARGRCIDVDNEIYFT